MTKAKPNTEPVPMKIERLALADLKPDPHNARRHPERNLQAIVASLDKFGQVRPILVDADNVIRAGNGTYQAAESLGWTHLYAVRTQLRGQAARDYAIADNRTAELAEWESDLLAAALTDRKEPDLLAMGFDKRETAAFLRHEKNRIATEAAEQGQLIDDAPEPADEVPEPPKKPTTRAGDVWELGAHRIICGDSFVDETFERLLGSTGDGPARLVDCVLTDPPYAIYGSSSGVSASVADDRMVVPFFEALFHRCVAVVKVHGHVYVHCDWRSYPALAEGARRAGIAARNVLVWDKGGSGLGSNYANTHEFIGFFSRMPKQRTMRSDKSQRGVRSVFRPNVIRVNRPSGKDRLHNAAKPVALLSDLIENSTDEGQRVLDPFLGSGSTLIAAHKVGRACVGVEVDPAWCDVIVERWQNVTGGKAKRKAARGGRS